MGKLYYHRLILDTMLPEKERIKKGIESLEKNGLVSHSTLGRRRDDPYGERSIPIYPNEYRIWFQDSIHGEFENYFDCLNAGECIVIRVDSDLQEKYDFEIEKDDQYFTTQEGDVVFFSEDCSGGFDDEPYCQWTIEPQDLEIITPLSDLTVFPKRWKKLSNDKFDFTPSKNLADRVAPTIPIEMRHHGFNPNRIQDYAIYLAYDECYGAWTEWNGVIQQPKDLGEVITDTDVTLYDLLENGVNYYCK